MKTSIVIPTTYPAVGEVFELTLDGDAPENQPLEMVRRDGYANDWKHNGPVVKGRHTKHFKLVEIGYCKRFAEVLGKLGAHGEIPNGQWRESFKTKYNGPDCKGHIGVADVSWLSEENEENVACFPFLDGNSGTSGFLCHDHYFLEAWRWLVEVNG